MEDQDQEEVVVKAVKELKTSLAKSVRSSEWSMENGLLYYRGVTYIFTFTFLFTLFDTWFAALSANYLLLFFDS